jgi:hypothetical protein
MLARLYANGILAKGLNRDVLQRNRRAGTIP